ncbi:hypothetical protein Taro_024195 [Colocasia esculenta]|uniref:Uncharacterized protein n=1 Tax=Colocasia esculenta TaxID=4460 RepID=A0A843VD06_COLES|nr:hypothetical protein [Colocasia esculenta]
MAMELNSTDAKEWVLQNDVDHWSHARFPGQNTEVYKAAYERNIQPIPTFDMPDPPQPSDVFIKPPTTKKLPGRPRKRRIHSRGENIVLMFHNNWSTTVYTVTVPALHSYTVTVRAPHKLLQLEY